MPEFGQESQEPQTPDFSKLFSSQIESLLPEDRAKLAIDYIDQFGHKEFTEELFSKAGITLDTMNQEHRTDSERIGSDPSRRELAMRLNYCQLVLQTPEGIKVPDYSKSMYQRIITDADIADYTNPVALKDEEYKLVNEPFTTNGIQNRAFQMDEDSKKTYIQAVQTMNRANSMIGLDRDTRIPDANLKAILYFHRDQPPSAS